MEVVRLYLGLLLVVVVVHLVDQILTFNSMIVLHLVDLVDSSSIQMLAVVVTRVWELEIIVMPF